MEFRNHSPKRDDSAVTIGLRGVLGTRPILALA
jgi:hypothetical protein